MNVSIVSELSESNFYNALEMAGRDWEKMINQPPSEGVVKGEDRSGWMGIVNVGLWPTEENFEKRCIIHTSLEGSGRHARNVEADKIRGYFVAKRIMKNLLEETRTVYTPAIKGQKIVYTDNDRGVSTREIYVNYEPRHLAFSSDGINAEEYAFYLGRDITRFMFVGMINMPRHIRPNFTRDSFRKTCMIDLDRFDPRTFYWNAADRFPTYSLNYDEIVVKEHIFLHNVAYYFLRMLLPEGLDREIEVIQKLNMIYIQGFAEEVKNLKGNKIGENIIERYYKEER